MKRLLAVAIAGVGISGFAQAASFVNGGFETGDMLGWTGSGGCWGGGSYYGWSCGTPPAVSGSAPVSPALFTGAPNNTIVGVGTDPITGASRVFNGSYAVRVNDSVNNYGVSIIRQSVTGYSSNDIYFEWNAVLQGSHGLTDSDYFSLTLHDLTSGTDLVSRAYSSAGSIGSGATGVTWTNFGGWYSSGWVVEHVDLAAAGAVGHDLTLELLASDCPYGGHAGYVYLDGFAPVIVPPGPVGVPEPASLALVGLGLAGLGAMRRRKFA